MKVSQIGRVGDIGGSSNVELYGIIFQLDSSHLTGSSLVVIMPHQISGMSRMEDATQRFCQIVGTMKLSHQYSTASVMAATAGSNAIVLVSKGSRAVADGASTGASVGGSSVVGGTGAASVGGSSSFGGSVGGEGGSSPSSKGSMSQSSLSNPQATRKSLPVQSPGSEGHDFPT